METNGYLGSVETYRQLGLERLYPAIPRVTVGMATCGRAAGAGDVFDAFQAQIERSGKAIQLVAVGCEGLCWAEPLVEILIPRQPRAVYANCQPSKVERLLEGIATGVLPEAGRLGWVYQDDEPLLEHSRRLAQGEANNFSLHPFLQFQSKQVMSNCGRIEPDSVLEYAATGGYQALAEALAGLSPGEVLQRVEASGLRGRGGAGFPTGRKLRLTRAGAPGPRYIIVNADEGDPGAYMDRGLLESDPHRVLEGLAIAAYIIGAQQAFFFIRSEYPLAIQTLQQAIAGAESYGLLGENILGSGFSLHVGLVRSAGAYVCGEESAMLNAMQNHRGEPAPRPPYPSERGLWGAPTCINNVETFANLPYIIHLGPEKFRRQGTPESPGTKIFSLVGEVQRPGLIEVPLGTPLSVVIETIGGTPLEAAKALQIGGPSGAILPVSATNLRSNGGPAVGSDLPIDYEHLQAAGGIMGSGGMVVLGSRACVVDTARYFLEFSLAESCGKCAPCRDGLAECAAILEKVTSRRAVSADLERLEMLGKMIAGQSMCGLGKMAPGPLLSSLRYFRQEYEEHLQGHCYALVCKPLIRFEIIESKCQGERCCLNSCPGRAVKGSFGKPGHIVDRLCTKCWMCTYTCPYHAIRVTT